MSRQSLGLTPEEMKAHRAELAKLRKQKRRDTEDRLCKEVVAHKLARVCTTVVDGNNIFWKEIYDAVLEEMLSHPEWKIKIEPTDD